MQTCRPYDTTRESYIVFFLAVWVCMLFRPFTPLLSDAYQHTFHSERHHTLMHQLGMHHTDEQVSALMNETNTASKTNTLAANAENPFIFMQETEENAFFHDIYLIAFRFSLLSVKTYIGTIQSPPPEFA